MSAFAIDVAVNCPQKILRAGKNRMENAPVESTPTELAALSAKIHQRNACTAEFAGLKACRTLQRKAAFATVARRQRWTIR